MEQCPAVLFLGYKRPDLGRQVLERIAAARPARLYMAVDGPKDAGEESLCAEFRALADAVSWPCEVRRRFRDRNLGCRRGISDALAWFFEHETEGIVLEEDCLPDPTFFEYCRQGLEKYREEPRVGWICGANGLRKFLTGSHCRFNQWGNPWGWASWRDRWQAHDPAGLEPIADWNDPALFEWLGRPAAVRFWQHRQEASAKGWVDSWFFPWQLHMIKTRKLALFPGENLVLHIGGGSAATHVKFTVFQSPLAPQPLPVWFPEHLQPDFELNLTLLLAQLWEITTGAGNAQELLGEIFNLSGPAGNLLDIANRLEESAAEEKPKATFLGLWPKPAAENAERQRLAGVAAEIRQAARSMQKTIDPLLLQNAYETGGRLFHAHIVYSQEGEDMILSRVLKGRKTGFYVDVGAHHPFRFSNTHRLYESGWQGINIEPTPGALKLFRIWRPRDVTLEMAAGAEAGQIDFHIFDEGGYNTASGELAAQRLAAGQGAGHKVITVPVRPLTEILDLHLPEGTAIDLLTIDTEGHDLEVLRGLDWQKYRPRLVICESLGDNDLMKASSIPVASLLDSLNYRFFAATFNSLLFELRA